MTTSWSFLLPRFDFREADADAEPVGSSLLFLRLDLRLDESLGACCGEVSPDVPEEGPALDISAAGVFLPPFFFASAGVVGASGSAGPPRTLLLLRTSR